jgi:hypothetical protein
MSETRLYGVLRAHAGGVNLDGVGGRLQRTVLALGVKSVALEERVADRLHILAMLTCSSAGALLHGGREKDLHLGIRHDDRAYVASLGNPVSMSQQRPLLVRQSRTDLRQCSHRGRKPADLRPADVTRHIIAVEQDAITETNVEGLNYLLRWSLTAQAGQHRAAV